VLRPLTGVDAHRVPRPSTVFRLLRQVADLAPALAAAVRAPAGVALAVECPPVEAGTQVVEVRWEAALREVEAEVTTDLIAD
jgi:hypothetical protein